MAVKEIHKPVPSIVSLTQPQYIPIRAMDRRVRQVIGVVVLETLHVHHHQLFVHVYVRPVTERLQNWVTTPQHEPAIVVKLPHLTLLVHLRVHAQRVLVLRPQRARFNVLQLRGFLVH